MKNILYNILIKIFFIFSFFKCAFTKSILVVNNISKGTCDNVLGGYIFNISSTLNGNLTESMLENYIIKSNNNNLKIKCHFHEENIPVENKDILINCYINEIRDNQLTLNYEGSNNYLELINNNKYIQYIDNIYCPNIKLRNTQEDTTEYSEESYSDENSETNFITDDIDMTSAIEPEPNCTNCCPANSNCDNCDSSGNCLHCSNGYYLTESNNNRKCLKCLSTCEECESLQKCTKCKSGYILSNNYCVSCFSVIEGCEECNQDQTCSKCYDNKNFKYTLNNNKCENNNEQKTNSEINLKFQRIDNYEKKDDTLYFKLHFILLGNYLSGAKLVINADINYLNRNILLRYIRNLNSETKNIDCSQYGDALGNSNKGGYLANFLCSTNIGNNEFGSITLHNIEIKDESHSLLQSITFENKEINVNEMQNSPLDEEYEQYNINKLTITKVSEIKLKDNLTFKIISNFDSTSSNEQLYDITLNNNKEKKIAATCTIPIINVLTDQNISCYASKENVSEKLLFEEGIYTAKDSSNERLILNNNNNVTIEVPIKKSLSIGAIIGITIAGIFLVGPFIYYLAKYLLKKKEFNNDIEVNYEEDVERNGIRNGDSSKEIIFR